MKADVGRRAFFGSAVALGVGSIGALGANTVIPARSGAITSAGSGTDPLLGEITAQLTDVVRGLAAAPPRGNARQLAALYRMASAWARANNIDARLRNGIDEALAAQGHRAFVTKLASVDHVAKAKQLGLPVRPNMRNPDATTIARAIGMLKGGMPHEHAWRITASAIDRKAAQFDRMIAIANGRRPTDATIRLIQDGCTDPDCSYVEYPPQDDCVQNPDGSFSCSFSNPTVVPDGPNCNSIDFVFDIFTTQWAILAFFIPELVLFAIVMGLSFEAWEWIIGC